MYCCRPNGSWIQYYKDDECHWLRLVTVVWGKTGFWRKTSSVQRDKEPKQGQHTIFNHFIFLHSAPLLLCLLYSIHPLNSSLNNNLHTLLLSVSALSSIHHLLSASKININTYKIACLCKCKQENIFCTGNTIFMITKYKSERMHIAYVWKHQTPAFISLLGIRMWHCVWQHLCIVIGRVSVRRVERQRFMPRFCRIYGSIIIIVKHFTNF